MLFLLYQCRSDSGKATSEAQHYSALGDSITRVAFQTLSGALKSALQQGGIENAFAVCNRKALRLTDSLSHVFHVKLKRTAHKIRNEANAPDAWEKSVIQRYLAMQKEGKPLKPIVEKDQTGKWRYAKPILVKPQCLMCHGEVSPQVKALLAKYYPNDQATGFTEGELRGIWSIQFP